MGRVAPGRRTINGTDIGAPTSARHVAIGIFLDNDTAPSFAAAGRVIGACLVADPDTAKASLDAGFRVIAYATDVMLLTQGFKGVVDGLRVRG